MPNEWVLVRLVLTSPTCSPVFGLWRTLQAWRCAGGRWSGGLAELPPVDNPSPPQSSQPARLKVGAEGGGADHLVTPKALLRRGVKTRRLACEEDGALHGTASGYLLVLGFG